MELDDVAILRIDSLRFYKHPVYEILDTFVLKIRL